MCIYLLTAIVASADEYGRQSSQHPDSVQNDGKKNTAVDLGQVTATGKIEDAATSRMPAVVESVTAEGVERINTVETSDAFKIPPSATSRPGRQS